MHTENQEGIAQKELIDSLYKAFELFRNKTDPLNYHQLESAITRLIENQNEMKNEIRELKEHLLNPNTGIIVAVNKNTAFRIKKEKNENEYEKILREHEELMKFKSTTNKLLWGILSGLGTMIIYYITKQL